MENIFNKPVPVCGVQKNGAAVTTGGKLGTSKKYQMSKFKKSSYNMNLAVGQLAVGSREVEVLEADSSMRSSKSSVSSRVSVQQVAVLIENGAEGQKLRQ